MEQGLHPLSDKYKHILHAIEGGQRHHGHHDAPEEEKGGGGIQPPASQSWRRHFGACFTLTIQSRLAITRVAEEDDEGDHNRVRGVWPHRIGGQD